MNILAFTLLISCLPAALIDFAIPKWKAEKNAKIEDAYKYIYQATRGGEHATPSAQAAKNSLDTEWQSLGDRLQYEPTWEPLCPDGSIGRLHLRPFRDEGGQVNDLLRAFLQSSSEYKTEPSIFIDAWLALGRRLKKQGFGKITDKDWKRLDRNMKKQNYPAIHHSDIYNKTRRPAYRILTMDQAQLLIPS